MSDTVTGQSLTLLSERDYHMCYQCLHSLMMAQCLIISLTVSVDAVFGGMSDHWKSRTVFLCRPAMSSFQRFFTVYFLFCNNSFFTFAITLSGA